MLRKIVVAGLARAAIDVFNAERASAEREIDDLRDELARVTQDRDRLLAALRELQSAVRARQRRTPRSPGSTASGTSRGRGPLNATRARR